MTQRRRKRAESREWGFYNAFRISVCDDENFRKWIVVIDGTCYCECI